MAIQAGSIGGISLKANEFKEIILEVTEDAVIARQASYDTTMEIMSTRKVATVKEAQALLAQLGEQGLAELAVRDPKGATELVKRANEEEEK